MSSLSPLRYVCLFVLALPALVTCKCYFEDFDVAVSHFSKVISFATVSDPGAKDHARDPAEFDALDEYLSSTYTAVWEQLKVEKVGVNSRSYLITWPGSQPELRPVLFISHVDVVPVPEESVKDWTHPPFSGAVADGYIWGRGTLDVKVSAVALLEAATALLKQGYSPHRTILFAFGQDEEVGGEKGAAEIAKLLHARGVEVEVIWDEGSTVLLDGVPHIIPNKPVAIVGTAEKGYQSVQVHMRSAGGHSSMPPIDGSSIGSVLGRVLGALDNAPPPVELLSPTREFLLEAARYAPAWISPLLTLAVKNEFTAKLVARVLAQTGRETAALVRMTAAPTVVSAGVADNVLPQQGLLSINFRLLPGQTQDAPVAYLKEVIAPRDLEVVDIVSDTSQGNPPSQVTDYKSPHFQLLKQAIQEVWEYDDEPIPVLPFLMPGGTDSKWYKDLTVHGTLRFVPSGMAMNDTKRVHGTNERISLEGFKASLCVYSRALVSFGSFMGSASNEEALFAGAELEGGLPRRGGNGGAAHQQQQ